MIFIIIAPPLAFKDIRTPHHRPYLQAIQLRHRHQHRLWETQAMHHRKLALASAAAAEQLQLPCFAGLATVAFAAAMP